MFVDTVNRLKDRRETAMESGADAGFTLIELMVVLLILAILLAIAIPTFLGVSNSANDRAAQSDLNTSLTDATNQYQNNQQSYGTAASMVTALTTAEKNLTFTTAAVTAAGPEPVSVATSTTGAGSGDGLILAAQSKVPNCWYIVSNTVAQVATDPAYTNVPAAELAPGTYFGKLAGSGSCQASAIPATGVTWSTSGFPAS